MSTPIFDGAVLYGQAHSYYTAIAKSYLRKQDAGVREVAASHPTFLKDISPKIGRRIIPVLVTADGQIIQDSLDIIEAGEAQGAPAPATPEDLTQRMVSALLFQYGSQALLRPAMHYRWSYYDQQAAFLDHAFGMADNPQAAAIMDKMRSYLPVLGVSKETTPAIEENFETLLDLLDTHLATTPYLFGMTPVIGDYGLYGPLFAHLGRDPYPADIMKARAPHVYRWTERMTVGTPDTCEFEGAEGPIGWQPGTPMPQTLRAILTFIGRTYGPEVEDRIAFIRQFVESQPLKDGQPTAEKPAQRAIGTTMARYGDTATEIAVQPYLLYCQRRVQNAWRDMPREEAEAAEALMEELGLFVLLDPNLSMTCGRRDNIEVWETVG